MKVVRPLKAIKLKCYDCSGWNTHEVTNCTHKHCVLWALRFGKKPKGVEYENMSGKDYMELMQRI